jgi:hypothetical protein
VYEAYSGEDIWTGQKLSAPIRALKIAAVASLGISKLTPKSAISRVIEWIRSFGKSAEDVIPEIENTIQALDKFKSDWPEAVAKLRAASQGVIFQVEDVGTNGIHNFTVGTVTKDEMEFLGKAWVGEGTVEGISDNGLRYYVSKDGLTQYRPPAFKPGEGKVQANLERRLEKYGKWISNAHFDISDMQAALVPSRRKRFAEAAQPMTAAAVIPFPVAASCASTCGNG